MTKQLRLSHRALTEFIGTLIFVFIGAGSAVTAYTLGLGVASLLFIALINGMILALVVTITVKISGGHMNPAVTLCMLAVKKIKAHDAVFYIIAQLAGATLGSLLLVALMPAAAGMAVHYGAPILSPSTSIWQGIVLEAIMTAILVFVVFGTIIDKHAPKIGGAGVGIIVFLNALIGGSLSGSMMNPARAMGPMIATLSFGNWYIYWVGPVIGAVAAALIYTHYIEE